MTTLYKCPHCGAPKLGDRAFLCGTWLNDGDVRRPFCIERTAHAATRDRLKEMTEIAEEFIARWRRMAARNCHDEWNKGYYEGHAACANELEAAFSRLEAARKETSAVSDTIRCPVCGKEAQKRTFGPFFTPDPTYRIAVACPDGHWRGQMKEAKP